METSRPTALEVSKDDYYKASEIMEYFKAGRWENWTVTGPMTRILRYSQAFVEWIKIGQLEGTVIMFRTKFLRQARCLGRLYVSSLYAECHARRDRQ